jgi:hypothetical protein
MNIANVPQPASESAAVLAVIERIARDPSVDIAKLEKMIDMQERVMAMKARVAYAAALASMQLELPEITELGKIDIGRGKPQTYARWEDINEKIKPILGKHGFALQFRTGHDEKQIVVTCILYHREGHCEQTTMNLPVDMTGSKNPVQAVGSSISYGKRYTASALLNLTSRGEDDDGKSAGDSGKTISAEEVENINDILAIIGDESVKPRLLKWLKKERIEDIPANRYDDAIENLKKIRSSQ